MIRTIHRASSAAFILALAVASAALAADDSLVLHYSFDKVSAAGVVKDLSEKGNDLKLADKKFLTDGVADGGLTIPPAGLKVQDSESLVLKPGSGLTIALWLKFDKDDVNWIAFAKKDAPVEGTHGGEPTAYRPFRGYNLGSNGSSTKGFLRDRSFRFTVSGKGGSEAVTAGPIGNFAKVGQWVHLAATYNPDPKDRGLRLFVNGKMVADKVMITMPTDLSNHAPLTIGRDLKAFEGAIDDLRIYHRVLSADEIKKLAAKKE